MNLYKFSTDELIVFVLDGDKLTAAQAQHLETDLTNDPLDIEKRMKLLGYYETRHLDSRRDRKHRQEHILWMLKNMITHPFMFRSFGVAVQSHDPEFYVTVKRLWMEAIKEHPQNAQVIANAAAHLIFSDLEESENLANIANLLDPQNPDVIALLRRVESVKQQRKS